jgi:hypothetical protein
MHTAAKWAARWGVSPGTDAFRTVVNIPDSGIAVDHSTPIFLIGACFTVNIGSFLDRYKFPVLMNPAGIQYNPASVEAVIERIIGKRFFTGDELFLSRGLWHSYLHHSDFSNPDKEDCLNRINAALESAAGFLKNATLICITFGTAWYYRLKENGSIVSNCHKQPPDLFTRHFLAPGEVRAVVQRLGEKIGSINSGARLLFTVSPVRHIKDGAVENQRSKSSLLLGIGDAAYFPAYEIMMDDLRDYRFYAEDMVHPNETAIGYILNRFTSACLTSEAREVCRRLDPVIKAAEHRPRTPGSEEHRSFVQSTLRKIEKFEAGHPGISLEKEREVLIGSAVVPAGQDRPASPDATYRG